MKSRAQIILPLNKPGPFFVVDIVSFENLVNFGNPFSSFCMEFLQLCIAIYCCASFLFERI